MSDYQFFLRGFSPKSKGAILLTTANDAQTSKTKINDPSDMLRALIESFRNAAVVFFFPEHTATQEFLDNPYIAMHDFQIDEETQYSPYLDATFYHGELLPHLGVSAEIKVSSISIRQGRFDPPKSVEHLETAQEQANRIRFNNMFDAALALSQYCEENWLKITAIKANNQGDLFMQAYQEKEDAFDRALERMTNGDGESVSD